MKSRNLGPLLVVLVVLIIALWPKIMLFWTSRDRLTLIEAAGAGEVVAGFSPSFIIPTDAQVTASGVYTDASGNKVLVTDFLTKAGFSDLFASYLNYLTGQNYSLEKTSFLPESSTILAKKGSGEVEVDVGLDGLDKRQVHIVLRDTMK